MIEKIVHFIIILLTLLYIDFNFIKAGIWFFNDLMIIGFLVYAVIFLIGRYREKNIKPWEFWK